MGWRKIKWTSYTCTERPGQLQIEQQQAELAPSIECLTAERKVAGLIPEARPILTPFALQGARPLHGMDDHVTWRSRHQFET